tara:strand:+ start:3652 stop:4038 length:387 start_codon:yes stop_codon:yes gene_type:complete
MILSDRIKEQIQNAEHKALATFGSEGLNVVPVSVVYLEGEAIIFCDFFMNKTVDNVKESGKMAFCAWSGNGGVQVKGSVEYLSSGDLFAKIEEAATAEYPDRILRGILKVTPEEVYDVTPGGTGAKLA